MAYYDFCECNELWRTMYSSNPLEQRPFEEIVDAKFNIPVDSTFFEFHERLYRIRLVLGKDDCPYRATDEVNRALDFGFNDAAGIPRMTWPLGGLDVSCEKSLGYSRNFCNHLRNWKGSQLLKALHINLSSLWSRMLKPHGAWNFTHWYRHKACMLKRDPRGWISLHALLFVGMRAAGSGSCGRRGS